MKQGRLRTASSYPELASLDISPEYLEKTHFRNPPKVEIGVDGVPRYRGEADDVEPSPHVLNSALAVGMPLLSEPLEVGAAIAAGATNGGKRNKRYDPYTNTKGKRKPKKLDCKLEHPNLADGEQQLAILGRSDGLLRSQHDDATRTLCCGLRPRTGLSIFAWFLGARTVKHVPTRRDVST